MFVLADFPFDSNVIVVLVAVIFAAIKAYLERGNKATEEEGMTEEELLEQYEAELRRQQEEMEAREAARQPTPVVSKSRPEPTPPPIPQVAAVPMPYRPAAKPVKPKLTAAEKLALENFQRLSANSRKRRTSGSTKSRVHRHLSSPTAAREALVLAEVLGPPKAFKESR